MKKIIILISLMALFIPSIVMATSASISGGVILPNPQYTTGLTNFTLNASATTKYAAIIKFAKTGTVNKVAIQAVSVSGSPTVTAEFQTLTSGLPSGSAYYGTNVSATTAISAGWNVISLGTPITATTGDYVAIVITLISTGSNYFTLQGGLSPGIVTEFPYVATYTTSSWTASASVFPNIGIEYSDGVAYIPGVWAIATITSDTTINTTTGLTPALLFQVPWSASISGIIAHSRFPVNSGATITLTTAAAPGTPLTNGTITVTGGNEAAAATGSQYYKFPATIALTKNVDYLIQIVPTTTTSAILQNFTVGADVDTFHWLDAMGGGYKFRYSSCTATCGTAGNWTAVTTKRPMISIILNTFDDGTGTGGSGGGSYGY